MKNRIDKYELKNFIKNAISFMLFFCSLCALLVGGCYLIKLIFILFGVE